MADGARGATMPVLVTGAAGFVGGHLVRALARRGRPVVATDVRPSLPDWVSRGVNGYDVRYLTADLSEPQMPQSLLGEAAGPSGSIDVVHLAARLDFHGEAKPRTRDIAASRAINVEVPWRMCEAAAARGDVRRLIHVSTRSVFGRRPPGGPAISERDPYAPVGLYGYSKAAGELGVLASASEFGLDAVVARITGVFGPWQPPTSPWSQVLDSVLRGTSYLLDVGPSHIQELTYVKDTVRGLLLLLEAPALAERIYHVSSGRMSTMRELLEIAHRLGDVSVSLAENQPDAFRRTPLDITRVADELGYRPLWDLKQAMADAVRAERTSAYGPEVDDGPEGEGAAPQESMSDGT